MKIRKKVKKGYIKKLPKIQEYIGVFKKSKRNTISEQQLPYVKVLPNKAIELEEL